MDQWTHRNLFLLMLLCPHLTELHLNQTYELISELRSYFFSQCVILQLLLMDDLDSPSVRRKGFQIQKFYSRISVMSTIVSNVKRVNHTLTCRGNRSLYVLLPREGDDPPRLLEELLSRLDPAGAVWLLLLDSPNVSVKDLFQSLYIPFDCEFLVAVESQGAVELTEVYRVHQTFPLVTSHWGSWSYRDGLRSPHFRLTPRRNDLAGLNFYVAAIHDPPVQKLHGIRHGDLQVTGFTADVMREMSRKLNFSLKIVHAEDNMYGIKHVDGTWDGAIGMVLDGKVNMSMTIFTINPARYRDVGFTVPVSKTRVAVYVRTTYETESSLEIYLSPFSGHLWLCVALCIALSTFCLVATQSWRGEEYAVTFSELLLSAWRMFCMQGFAVPFGSSSVRLVIWVSFLTAVVLTASYSARIISFLAVRKPKMPFSDLQGLLEEESYGFGMMRSIAALQDFREGVGVRRLLYEHKLAPKLNELPLVNSVGFERACKEEYAFLCNDIFVDYDTIGCDMSLFYITTSSNPMAYILPKKSPYVKIIDYTLRQMKISGLVSRLRDVSKSTVRNEDRPTLDVEVHDVLALLLLCVSAVVLSLVLLLAEVLVHYGVRARHSAVIYLH